MFYAFHQLIRGSSQQNARAGVMPHDVPAQNLSRIAGSSGGSSVSACCGSSSYIGRPPSRMHVIALQVDVEVVT
eukprot:4770957-Pleurochrysis_carterae.AAC.1